MYIVVTSRKGLKDSYKKEKGIVVLNKEKKIDIDLDPTVKLFSKIYTQAENKVN